MPKSKKVRIETIQYGGAFRLIALSSTMNLNRALWSINSKLNWNLAKSSSTVHQHTIFADRQSLAPITVALIPNKQPNGELIAKKIDNIDYFIEIHGEMVDMDFLQLLKKLKQIDGIQATIEIDPKSIKQQLPFTVE